MIGMSSLIGYFTRHPSQIRWSSLLVSSRSPLHLGQTRISSSFRLTAISYPRGVEVPRGGVPPKDTTKIIGVASGSRRFLAPRRCRSGYSIYRRGSACKPKYWLKFSPVGHEEICAGAAETRLSIIPLVSIRARYGRLTGVLGTSPQPPCNKRACAFQVRGNQMMGLVHSSRREMARPHYPTHTGMIGSPVSAVAQINALFRRPRLE
jgi:hypothetical protein